MIQQTFTRGGKTFEATIDPPYLTIRDAEYSETGGPVVYKFNMLKVMNDSLIATQMTRGHETPTGKIIHDDQATIGWYTEDRQFFYDKFGETIMKFMVNGFIREFMGKKDEQYQELESEFNPAFDEAGNFISENED